MRSARTRVGPRTESWLGVPILGGERVLGVIAVSAEPPDAYSEADERLLSTLASSMGVALENARLFDETKRLLAETDERAAELVDHQRASRRASRRQLDMQAMYDLVGDKIREIFDAQVVDIAILDRAAGDVPLPVRDRTRCALPGRADPDSTGFRRHVIETRRRCSSPRTSTRRCATYGNPIVTRARTPKAGSVVPLIVGDEAKGVISLQNLDDANAFGEADVRLLTTLAGSLSVALENARLFDETKRLLAETDERAAELAIINERPGGPRRSSSTCRRCTTSSATRSRRSSTRRSSTSRRTTARRGDPASTTRSSAASDSPNEPIPLIGVPASTCSRRASRCSINEDMADQTQRYGQHGRARWASRRNRPLGAPARAATKPSGVISLQNLDRENAFSESDVRLLATLAASLSVALENARLFDETQRLLAETDERAAELAIINGVQQGLAAAARHAGDVRARRRQGPGDLRRPGRRHRRRTTRKPG